MIYESERRAYADACIMNQPASSSLSTGLMLVAAALMLIGLVMVGTSSVSADRSLWNADWSWSVLMGNPFGRQLLFVPLALAAMAVGSVLGARWLDGDHWVRTLAYVLFAVALLALIAALIPGLTDERRGSRRWLSLAALGLPIGFQPSEFAKLALVGALAAWLTRRGHDPRSLGGGFLPAAGAVGLSVALIGTEDFGTSALLACTGFGLLLVGGCRLRHLGTLAAVGAVGMAGLIFAAPYRLGRITAFRNLWDDVQGDGYQPVQSLTTIASGGWWGTGLGSGVQKYGYLPEAHTDFIFAVICEEMGFAGGVMVLALFALFVFLGLVVVRRARTPFERLLAFGLTTVIGLQAALNVAVVTVLTPTTGISLPFISAGGSNLLAFALAVGILSAIARRACAEEAAPVDDMAAAREAFRAGHATPTPWGSPSW